MMRTLIFIAAVFSSFAFSREQQEVDITCPGGAEIHCSSPEACDGKIVGEKAKGADGTCTYPPHFAKCHLSDGKWFTSADCTITAPSAGNHSKDSKDALNDHQPVNHN